MDRNEDRPPVISGNFLNRRETVAGLTALTSLAATKGQAMTSEEKEILQKAFALDAIAAENAKTDGPWLEIFQNNTMLTGLYEIPAGGADHQKPHRYDELYFITKGKANLIAGDETFPAKAGSIFFVKAHVPHRFVDIDEDLQVLVFFSKADPNGETAQ